MLESVVPWGVGLVLAHTYLTLPMQVSHDSSPNGLIWKGAGKEQTLHSCVRSSRESRDSHAPRSSSIMLEAPCSTVRAPACGMTCGAGRYAETISQFRVRQWITDRVGGQGSLYHHHTRPTADVSRFDMLLDGRCMLSSHSYRRAMSGGVVFK